MVCAFLTWLEMPVAFHWRCSDAHGSMRERLFPPSLTNTVLPNFLKVAAQRKLITKFTCFWQANYMPAEWEEASPRSWRHRLEDFQAAADYMWAAHCPVEILPATGCCQGQRSHRGGWVGLNNPMSDGDGNGCQNRVLTDSFPKDVLAGLQALTFQFVQDSVLLV